MYLDVALHMRSVALEDAPLLPLLAAMMSSLGTRTEDETTFSNPDPNPYPHPHLHPHSHPHPHPYPYPNPHPNPHPNQDETTFSRRVDAQTGGLSMGPQTMAVPGRAWTVGGLTQP